MNSGLRKIPEESSRSNRVPFSEKDTLLPFKNQDPLFSEYPSSSELRQSKSSPHFENPKPEPDYLGIDSRNKMMMSTPRDFRDGFDFGLSGVYGEDSPANKLSHHMSPQLHEKIGRVKDSDAMMGSKSPAEELPSREDYLRGGKIYQLIEGMLYIEKKLEGIRCKLA